MPIITGQGKKMVDYLSSEHDFPSEQIDNGTNRHAPDHKPARIIAHRRVHFPEFVFPALSLAPRGTLDAHGSVTVD